MKHNGWIDYVQKEKNIKRMHKRLRVNPAANYANVDSVNMIFNNFKNRDMNVLHSSMSNFNRLNS